MLHSLLRVVHMHVLTHVLLVLWAERLRSIGGIVEAALSMNMLLSKRYRITNMRSKR